MNARELLQLIVLLAKFRAAFSWSVAGDRDGYGKHVDAMLRDARLVLRVGKSYRGEQWEIAK